LNRRNDMSEPSKHAKDASDAIWGGRTPHGVAARIQEAIIAAIKEKDAEIERLKKEVQPTWMHTCLHHTDEERMMAARGCPCCAVKEIHRLERTLDQRDERIDQMWMILKDLHHCGPTFKKFKKPDIEKCSDDCPACARDRLQETLHD